MLTNKQLISMVTQMHKAVRLEGMSTDTDAIHPLRTICWLRDGL